ncbi:PPE domain-containing protein [Nocardia brasiliensis]|uniref:PPE domain-containing protein n=1 Tax=Nocardia brasiliensis TaxID=37326 RepID=A0A6G9XUU6_NOCBR|nr:hypothetical protein [Nocardia brasiliensis]QIS04741.1 PPE domain-containing protein [Nocardia brasiliensis]
MTYDEYRARIIAAQEQWNRDRANIYVVTSIGTDRFHGGYEPPRITNEDLALFETLPLADLVQRVAAMRPGTVLQAAEAWFKIGAAFEETTKTFNTSVQRTIANGWSGRAAGKAAEAVRTYSEGAGQLSTSAHLLYVKLTEMYTGLNQTQALMPGLTDPVDLKGKTLPADGVMKTGDYTEDEAREEAKRILQTVYWQVANQTDNGVPIIPPAPTVVSDPQAPVMPSPGPSDPGASNPSTAVPTGTDDNAGTRNEPADQPNNVASDANPSSSTQAASAAAPTTANPSTANPSTATPTTTTGTPAGTPLSPTPPPTGTPLPGRPSRVNPVAPLSRPGPGATTGEPGRQPGRSVPATPQQPAVAPADARTAAGTSAARAGAGGMPGMAPGAAGRGNDDEKTTGTKDYLITKEHGEEVTGLDALPKTVPPVIGDHG